MEFNQETLDAMNSKLEELAKRVALTSDQYDKISKGMEAFMKKNKEHTERMAKDGKTQKEQAEKQIATLKRLKDQYDRGIISLEEFEDKTKDATWDLERLQRGLDGAVKAEAKAVLQEVKNVEIKKKAAEDFGKALRTTGTDAIKKLFAASTSLLTTVQSGVNGIQIASQTLTAGVDLIGAGASGAAGAIGGVGSAMTQSGNKFGIAVSGVAAVIDVAGKAFTAYETFRIKFMTAEIEKYAKAYESAGKVGISFADGLGGLKKSAADAGLTVQQYGNVVAANAELLQKTGLGVTGGMKKVSASMKAGGEEFTTQMLNLGISYEEQASLTAQYSAQMNAAGKLRSMSDAEVAAGTVKYAKDLRVLSDIIGADAKAKTEEAKKQALRASIMNKLGPEERERFQAAYRSLAPELQKGFMELVVSGGQVVTDAATNIANSQNPVIMETLKASYANVKNSQLSATEVQDMALKDREKLGESVRNAAQNGNTALTDAYILLGGKLSGPAAEAAAFQDALISSTQTVKGSTEASRQAVEQNAATKNEETKQLTAIMKKGQETALIVQEEAFKRMGAFLGDMNKALDAFLQALNPTMWDKVTGAADAAATALMGLALSAVPAMIGNMKSVGSGPIVPPAAGAASGTPRGPQPRDPVTGRFISREAAAAAAPAAPAAAAAPAASAASGAAKAGLGKAILGKLPGVGLVLGLADAGSRLMRGDVAGAGLAAGAGAAAMLPGLGTAASIGLSGALIAKDMGAFDRPKAEATAPEITGSSSAAETDSSTNIEVNTKVVSELQKMSELMSKQTKLAEEANSLRSQLVELTESHKRIAGDIRSNTA